MMTLPRRSVSSPLPKSAQSKLSVLQFAPVQRGLTHELASRLAADITGGKLAPGSRLPTEQEMIVATGVSRTVVREAVAALRAEGLVVTRQGVGAFVADNARRPFRIEPDEVRSIREVLEVMELRTGIEIEAAGLAAERGSPADVRGIADAYEAVDQAIERGESGVDQDFAFHCSIAQATGNPKFLRFLEYLGRFIIPRQTINLTSGGIKRVTYLKTFQKEHRVILDAIRSKAVTQARAAMRRHLHNSRKRYHKLAAGLEQAGR
jgi:GntR family transcriptional regulator, transcriptional repressor for pyruvate dehydrogenase complex